MKPIDAIAKMMERSGTPRKALAETLGRSLPSISNMFRQAPPDMRMSTMLGACACAGYKMLLVSEDGDRIEVDLQPADPEPETEPPGR